MSAHGSGVSHAQTTHEKIAKAALEHLGATLPAIRNSISSHKIKSPVSFSSLSAFLISTKDFVVPSRVCIGSLDGNLILSVRLRIGSKFGRGAAPTAPAPSTAPAPAPPPAPAPAPAARGKRGRDDASERATNTMNQLKKRSGLSASTLKYTHNIIEQLLRVQSADGTSEVIESCGLSVAASDAATTATGATATGATPTFGKAQPRPRLIIACRLSAGVALPLGELKAALGDCFLDGMLTTDASRLSSEFQLPLSSSGKVVEAKHNQKSILLFAGVPILPAAKSSE